MNVTEEFKEINERIERNAEFINIMNAVTMSNEGRVLLKSLYNISLSSH